MRKANTSKLVSIFLKENNAMANGFITKQKKTKGCAKVVLKLKKLKNQKNQE